MKNLDDLALFVAIARAGGVSAAATKLRLPKSSVSRALGRLEEAMGVRLVHRTTRRVRLSSAGEALLAQAEPLLSALEETLQQTPSAETPSGLLRITCTTDFGATVVADVVTRFTARFPAVQVEVHSSNALVDLVAGGFDLGIRFSLTSTLRDSSLVGHRAGVIRSYLVAAPGYLARRGVPRVPKDLADHDWVTYGAVEAMLRALTGVGKRSETHARIRCNDMFFVRAAVRAGAGIASLPYFLAEPEISAGSLLAVLPKLALPTVHVWLVHPPARQLPAKVTLFRDLLLEVLPS